MLRSFTLTFFEVNTKSCNCNITRQKERTEKVDQRLNSNFETVELSKARSSHGTEYRGFQLADGLELDNDINLKKKLLNILYSLHNDFVRPSHSHLRRRC